jgi:hypothetical protein
VGGSPLDDAPDIKAWQAALAAFQEAAGNDPNVTLRWSIAWAATVNAVMAYVREMQSREKT